jgi:ferredoxin-type protein NapH
MKPKSLISSLSYSIVIMACLAALSRPLTIGSAIWVVFVGAIAFLIAYTGQISRWRGVFFITIAWGFLLSFKAHLLGLHGKWFFSPDIREVPFCHIAIAASFFNSLYQQVLAWQSHRWAMWGPLSIGFLWLAVTLAIGRGFCSWGCFYGGLDEGFSRLGRRPLVGAHKLPSRWRDLPAAMLLFMLLVSLGTMLPIFCLWVCPLKITTAFLDPMGPARIVQLILFSTVGLAALVILPFLFKKRVFCGLICPFGAWQSFVGRLHPVRVTITPDLCTRCGKCERACPTWAIGAPMGSDPALERGLTPSVYCNLCGECIAACPEQAIHYSILGRDLPPLNRPRWLGELWDVGVVFSFAGLLVGGAIGALFIPPFLARAIQCLR